VGTSDATYKSLNRSSLRYIANKWSPTNTWLHNGRQEIDVVSYRVPLERLTNRFVKAEGPKLGVVPLSVLILKLNWAGWPLFFPLQPLRTAYEALISLLVQGRGRKVRILVCPRE